MVPKYFFAFCAFVLVLAFVSINAEEEPESQYESLDAYLEDDNEIEDKNPIIKKILKILEKAFKHVAKNCLEGAAKHCKKYWYNPSKLIDCATDFLSDGSCIVGQ